MILRSTGTQSSMQVITTSSTAQWSASNASMYDLPSSRRAPRLIPTSASTFLERLTINTDSIVWPFLRRSPSCPPKYFCRLYDDTVLDPSTSGGWVQEARRGPYYWESGSNSVLHLFQFGAFLPVYSARAWEFKVHWYHQQETQGLEELCQEGRIQPLFG